LFHAGGQTDGQDRHTDMRELILYFRCFAKAHKYTQILRLVLRDLLDACCLCLCLCPCVCVCVCVRVSVRVSLNLLD